MFPFWGFRSSEKNGVRCFARCQVCAVINRAHCFGSCLQPLTLIHRQLDLILTLLVCFTLL